MNMARKHVKSSRDRWYYWCDKLGLLVWQDMPSGERRPRQRREPSRTTAASCKAMIDALHNHPVDRDVGAVQRRLGPARHRRSRRLGRRVRPDAAGERGQRLARPRHAARSPTCTTTPAPACGRSRTSGPSCSASSAAWACRSPATPGRTRRTGATSPTTRPRSSPTPTSRC